MGPDVGPQAAPEVLAEEELCCMERGRVVGEVQLRQIAKDVWSLFTIHAAGNSRSRFALRVPNRMYVFRVQGAGAPSLVVVNAVKPDPEKDEPFGALRALSRRLGAPIRYILNPGPEHHLLLAEYARAFPDVRVCVAGGRIERENPELVALPNVETLPVGDVLPELRQQGLHVHVWDGFMEHRFIHRSQFRFSARKGTAEPVMFWHETSGALLNGGHGWFHWPEDTKQPWAIRKLMKLRQGPGHVSWSPIHYMVHDHARCAESARRILDWRFSRLIDLHAELGHHSFGDVYPVAEQLMRPLIEGDWDALPFGMGTLEIPEGTVTGGDWKSYRSLATSTA